MIGFNFFLHMIRFPPWTSVAEIEAMEIISIPIECWMLIFILKSKSVPKNGKSSINMNTCCRNPLAHCIWNIACELQSCAHCNQTCCSIQVLFYVADMMHIYDIHTLIHNSVTTSIQIGTQGKKLTRTNRRNFHIKWTWCKSSLQISIRSDCCCRRCQTRNLSFGACRHPRRIHQQNHPWKRRTWSS